MSRLPVRLAAAVLAGLGLVPGVAAQAPEHETTRVADGVYRFRFQGHNGFFVVGERGVVAVDPISTAAAVPFSDAIREAAPDKPLVAVVYSHDHADHATGAPVLFARLNQAPIIAHEAAAPKIVERDDPDLPPPDLKITDEHVIDLGDRRVVLRYLGKSHSDNMVVTFLPAEKIAFAVDFVSNDRVGFRELPDYHYPDFIEALKRLQELDYETIVFGHGSTGDRASIDRQISYYEALRDAVAEAIAAGWSEDEAAERVRLPVYREWGRYEEWFPLNVRAMHRFLSEGG